MKDLKEKYKEFYPKLKVVSLRYGMGDDFYNDVFLKNNHMDFKEMKKTLIYDWVNNPRKPINEKTENVYINVISTLNPTQRLIFNMHCMDSFNFENISIILKMKKDLVTEIYNKTIKQLEENEEINNNINDDVYFSVEC